IAKPLQKIKKFKNNKISVSPIKPDKILKPNTTQSVSSYKWIERLINGYMMAPTLGVTGSIITNLVELAI
ncbi:unnamed protein product, partial [marine sediment metagenome]